MSIHKNKIKALALIKELYKDKYSLSISDCLNFLIADPIHLFCLNSK